MVAFAANASLDEVVGCFKGAEYMEEFGTIKKHIKRSLASEGKERVSRYEANPKDHLSQLVAIVMKDMYFTNLFQVHTVNKIRKKKKTSKADFSSVFPGEFSKFKAEVLQDMVDKKEIECVEGKYEITYPSFREYIEGLEEGRAKTCILEKAQGRTLEEIGTTFGITRERVRQIIVKTMEGRPRLKEDKYLYLFEKYDLDKEKVQQIFEFEPYSYEYYCMVTKKGGTRNYLEMMEEDLPAYVKKNLENYRYRDCLDIDGEKVEKNRNSILQYILRTRCRDEVTETQVRQYFDAFLKEYGLDGSDKFQYPERYFEMKLSTKPDVLWKHGKKLRYFVMSEEDFKKLLEEIHFHDLKDVEISTKELFLAYPEIMKKYDLRDEYELHNLMKKHMPDSDIDFNRMPHIGIGNYK
jgi:hypothetical protein